MGATANPNERARAGARSPDGLAGEPAGPDAAPPALLGPRAALAPGTPRPQARGKFLFVGDEKLYVRGVTYGTFRPREDDVEFPDQEVVDRDFAAMAANGINAVRTYSVPPRWLLDVAAAKGLRVMIGLPVERFIGYLAGGKRLDAPDPRELVRDGVRRCLGHPAVLCYAVGNEIPASIARWYSAATVTRFLARLAQTVREEDPEALVTYVNYPSTEYLHLPFVDLVCFNVFLETREPLEAYLARLQNLAGDRPLVITELGLDSRRNGEATQAESLAWQIRTTFAAGCAGAFAYAWTDEWYRAGAEVDDWDFGLTRRDRTPKPALAAVRAAFAEVPFPDETPWPRISVVVCTYNGARTLPECLEHLGRLDYPDYEVIVVNDGSSDATPEIVRDFRHRAIHTPNRGLSAARNAGLEAATGSIVAYIDDDAYPDPHWLTYLAAAFLNSEHAGVGGPNIPPPDDGFFADCVASAPGNPVHVLLSDRVAEHIPGCNMAFRKSALAAIGGFDTQFRVAGDDIDVCWRLQQRGGTLGFCPAAVVWHHRRGSIRNYWRQQRGYGRAEAMVARKWPEKYGGAGQITWAGRLYGRGLPLPLGWARSRIYHGMWGSAPFQPRHERAPGFLASLPQMPEWYLLIGVLAVFAALGFSWPPLRLAALPLAAAAALTLVQASVSAARAIATPGRRAADRLRAFAFTTPLYLLQPVARLSARIASGLTPWRRAGAMGLAPPGPATITIWSDHWRSPEERLLSLEAALRSEGACVRRGGPFDRWDLEVWGGAFGTAELLLGVEDHALGKQLVRIRTRPRASVAPALVASMLVLAFAAGNAHAWLAASVFGCAGLFAVFRTFRDCTAAHAALLRATGQTSGRSGDLLLHLRAARWLTSALQMRRADRTNVAGAD